MAAKSPFSYSNTELLNHFNELRQTYWQFKKMITPVERVGLKPLLELYEPVQIYVAMTNFAAHCKLHNIPFELHDFYRWTSTAANVPTLRFATVLALLASFKPSPLRTRLADIRMMVEGYENSWFYPPELTKDIALIDEELKVMREKLE